MKAADSYAIAAIMVQIDGWEKSWERHRIPIYGQQRIYVRRKEFRPVLTDAYCDRADHPVPEFLE